MFDNFVFLLPEKLIQQNVVPLLRPLMADVFSEGLPRTLFCMLCLAIADLSWARHTKARYFALHILANFFITINCWEDVYHILTDPLDALSGKPSTNLMPSFCCVAIHLYHILFFRDLTWIDWLHHIPMIGVLSPLSILYPTGPCNNWNLIFICGIPGGIDYVMLYLVKHNQMERLQEKKYNSLLNIWIRLPGILFTIPIGYFWLALNKVDSAFLFVAYLMGLLTFWNPIFFAERVVGNYHVAAYIEESRGRCLKGSNGEGNKVE
eukprot:Sdes_comp23817_c0_seq1m21965